MTLRPATIRDIETIMEIERQPGFEHLVGRSARSIHEELIADPGHAYLLGLDADAGVRGLAILRSIGDPNGGIYLKRIAIRDPGQGYGSTMLAAVIDWAFSLGDINRFHLDHFVTNARAHRAYEKCGLRQEGILRGAYRLPDGRYADLAVMAITRPEWAVMRKREAWKAKLDALSPLQRKLREKSLAELARARRDLFAPLGPDVTVETDPGFIFSLWNEMKAFHPESHQANETARHSRQDGAAADLIRSISADLDSRVDLLFLHPIADPAFVEWHETFAGALDCDLGQAIDMIDALDRAGSTLLDDDVAIAAKDRLCAIWLHKGDVVLVSRPT